MLEYVESITCIFLKSFDWREEGKGVFYGYFSNGLEGHGNTFLNQEESFYNYLGICTLFYLVKLYISFLHIF